MINFYYLSSVVSAVPHNATGKGFDALPPMFTCPSGYKESGAGCIAIQETTPTVKCPKGSKLDGKHCYTIEKYESVFKCPTDTYMDKKKCYKTKEAMPERVCPKDFDTDGVSCLRTSSFATTSKCPKGFHMDSGMCFMHEKCKDKILSCPVNYMLEGKFCLQYLEENPILECKKGELSGLDCIDSKHEEAEIKCPKEYKFDDGICTKTKKAKSEYVCVTGELDEAKCVYDMRQPPTFTCKKDYQLVAGKCVKVHEEEAQPKCPKDYKFEGGMCLYRVSEKPEEICPEGSLEDGHCYTHETTEASIYCKGKDAELTSDGRCRSSTKLRVEMKCPKGYKMDGGVCTAVDKVKPYEDCPENIVTVKPEVYCKKGDLSMDGQCVTVESKEPKHDCPKGYKLDGKMCSQTYYVAGVEVCEQGEFKGGKCEVSLKTSPQLNCKKDYTLSHNGMCVKTVHAEGDMECPSGYYLKEGVCHREQTIYYQETQQPDYHVKKDHKDDETYYFGVPEAHAHHGHHLR